MKSKFVQQSLAKYSFSKYNNTNWNALQWQFETKRMCWRSNVAPSFTVAVARYLRCCCKLKLSPLGGRSDFSDWARFAKFLKVTVLKCLHSSALISLIMYRLRPSNIVVSRLSSSGSKLMLHAYFNFRSNEKEKMKNHTHTQIELNECTLHL